MPTGTTSFTAGKIPAIEASPEIKAAKAPVEDAPFQYNPPIIADLHLSDIYSQ